MSTALVDASPQATTTTRAAFADGVRDITPMVLGVVPFGFAIGAAITTTSLSLLEGFASGPLVLAGAAQLTTVQMLDAGAAPLVIVLSAVIINARLLLYSASLAPWFRREPLGRRMLLAVPVVDQLHFTCLPRFERNDLDRYGRIAYYTGASAWLTTAWIGSQSVAMLAGARLPDSLGLEVAAPLALVGLLAKSTPDKRSGAAAVVAGAVVLAGAWLPFQSAVIAGALAGIATAGIGTKADR
ncbi:MAG: AzlC family ABC transporter permease [Ilumatobacter sp.]|uniref:AzlC family ABC transporter permease n=1 Tax=Ilumatobacter sp. TaxID=1967498 RepID=UPI002612E9D5|nr:AzlC family ABC transporter permease [Ilumatobacter sp.]MDJ0768510.1 AzlC family ABC transporter permease [Ilumatobacter sp.]